MSLEGTDDLMWVPLTEEQIAALAEGDVFYISRHRKAMVILRRPGEPIMHLVVDKKD